jgi:starch-binding outer membrane protein, SusD/RagB family
MRSDRHVAIGSPEKPRGPMTRSASRRSYGGRALLLLLVLLTANSCTDLTEVPKSAITPDNFYQNEGEVMAGLASVYAQLRGTLWGYYNLSQVSSDETIVPTRGSDWYDNGRWLEIHRQAWSPTSPSALDDINGTYVDLFTGVARANVLLHALEDITVANHGAIVAEIRTLRAFYYYLLLDMFGGVPIVALDDDGRTDIAIMPRPRSTRREVFDFIATELTAARGDLPLATERPRSQNGRLTRGSADAILASLFLNAGVMARDVEPHLDQGINATSYNSCVGVQVAGGVDACQAAITAVDAILNSGAYTLSPDFRANFRADNIDSPENILVVKHLNDDGLGMNFLHRSLHYHQLSPSPWNGFSTLAETYYAFDADDGRTEIFLVGCQNDFVTGEPLTDRSGAPLCFTPEINDPTDATEAEGVRVAKWPPDPDSFGPDAGNDFTYFRLAEMYLIKAEAMNEVGQTAAAIQLINETVRDRAFDPPRNLDTGLSQAAARAAILDERLFELTTEAKRRQDLIRHGAYTQAWFGKPAAGPHVVQMPIPQGQRDTNPLLVQNQGYD